MTAVCEPEQATAAEAAQPAEKVILKEREAMPISPPPTRIVLTGFMGAGKSTVGRLLAAQLGWRFIDVDDEITAKAGAPVSEIFAKYGEFVFRRMETSAIAHALGAQDAVLALGGGAVEVLANRLLLEQTPRTVVVFLRAALPVLLSRCHGQAGAPERPNLPAAEERFRYREPLYRRVAKLRIDTDGQDPQQTASLLQEQLGIVTKSCS